MNPNTAERPQDYKTPADQTRVVVTHRDLPIHCPAPDASLWDAHPRVYIPVEENGGEARCIYCGALYVLEDEPAG